ncbi:hypothetical protein L1887_59110 [Cichorium endivia]|nr:hypothetical protein L1887_59110 [Cichorium endivia]
MRWRGYMRASSQADLPWGERDVRVSERGKEAVMPKVRCVGGKLAADLRVGNGVGSSFRGCGMAGRPICESSAAAASASGRKKSGLEQKCTLPSLSRLKARSASALQLPFPTVARSGRVRKTKKPKKITGAERGCLLSVGVAETAQMQGSSGSRGAARAGERASGRAGRAGERGERGERGGRPRGRGGRAGERASGRAGERASGRSDGFHGGMARWRDRKTRRSSPPRSGREEDAGASALFRTLSQNCSHGKAHDLESGTHCCRSDAETNLREMMARVERLRCVRTSADAGRADSDRADSGSADGSVPARTAAELDEALPEQRIPSI